MAPIAKVGAILIVCHNFDFQQRNNANARQAIVYRLIRRVLSVSGMIRTAKEVGGVLEAGDGDLRRETGDGRQEVEIVAAGGLEAG